jgi:plasmid stabilization system protein ParE
MNYKIEYISTFHDDVQSFREYLSDFPNKAARIFAKIDKIIPNLKTMPEMFPIYPDVPRFRFIVVEDYLVFYKIKHKNKLVEIHRLLNSRMNISAHFP